MKKIVSILVLVVVIALGYYFYQQSQDNTKLTEEPKKEVIKIGAILPLSGPISFLGKPVQESLDLYIEKNQKYFNKKGYKLSVVYGDSKGNAKEAVTVFNKMISQDNINVVLPFLTNVSLAINPIAEKSNILTMALSVYPPVTENGVTVKIFYDFKTESKKLVEYLTKKSYKNILIIYSEDAASKYQYDQYFNNDLSAANIDYDNTSFKVRQKDFKNTIPSNLKKYDAILLNGFGSDFPNILKTLKLYDNLSTPIISGIGMYEIKKDTDFDLVKNSVFAIPSFLVDNNKNFQDFNNAFLKKYNHKNNSFMAIFAYDNMELLKTLIDNNKFELKNGKNNKLNIINLKKFNGLTGEIIIDYNGNSNINISLAKFDEKYKLNKIE